MSAIKLEKLTKVYLTGVIALDGLDLDVRDGEFVVLVGPSGCGKTTALRLVAGLESITSGSVAFDGHVVNGVSPRQRDVAMVFQNYALYPHLTVAENIGFALVNKKVPRVDRDQRIRSAADVLGLPDLLNRRPAQLSGGQRQRVAMARALVRSPAVFLMDEPLSNLDAKLRVAMRSEVLAVHRSSGAATLYVTHDQTEAMTMGDRVAVLRDGVLQQYGTPRSLYTQPANLFVAGFMGSPEMNLYEAGVCADGSLTVGSQRLSLPSASRPAGYQGRKIVVGIRPEDLCDPAAAASPGAEAGEVEKAREVGEAREADEAREAGKAALSVDVRLVEVLGSEQHVYFAIDATPAAASGVSGVSGSTDLAAPNGVARVAAAAGIRAGSRVRFSIDAARLHFFDPDTGAALPRGLPPRRSAGRR